MQTHTTTKQKHNTNTHDTTRSQCKHTQDKQNNNNPTQHTKQHNTMQQHTSHTSQCKHTQHKRITIQTPQCNKKHNANQQTTTQQHHNTTHNANIRNTKNNTITHIMHTVTIHKTQ